MANISQENINSLAQEAFTISDGDYIYIYKSGAGGFARIEKSALFAGISTSGGGMSAEVYAAIQANVETLRSMLYTLTKTWLANLAFTNGRPSDSQLAAIANAFSWPENDGGSGGGDTPTGNPSLTVYVDGVAVSNGSTINVGTKTSSSGSVSKTITVKGSNLTKALTASLSGTGFYFGSSGTQTSQTILANNANASSGWTLTVRYEGSDTSATGTLTISSSEVSVTVNLTASYQEQGGGDEPTPSGITFSKPSFKLNSIISASSSNGNIVTETRNGHVCCTEFVELTGEWDRVEINYNFSNQSIGEAIYSKVVCRYKNLDNNTTGYTSAGANSIVTTTNNNYDKDTSNLGIISVKRLWENERLESGQAEGNYEVTGIAFSVRQVSDAPSGLSYAKIYADASDTNPQFIFDGSNSSTYDIET